MTGIRSRIGRAVAEISSAAHTILAAPSLEGGPAQVDRIDRKDILVRARLDAAGRPVLDALVIKGEDFGRTARLW